jgi:hypothetical protein
MTKKSHKKQHFVPQCYTKAWIDPTTPVGQKVDPFVWVFDRKGANARRKSPANLFTETDIYTITKADGRRDLYLEHGFGDLEDRFTRIRNLRFAKNQWPTDEEMIYLLAFVATFQARTQANRDHQRQQWGNIRKRMEEMQNSYEEARPARKAVFERMDSIGPNGSDRSTGMTIRDVKAMEEFPIQTMMGTIVKTVLPIFQRMSCAVLQTYDPIGFVTSDQPCTWFDSESYKLQPIFRGPGLNSPTIEVTLPISPKQCLVLSHRPKLNGYIDIPQHVVDELNYRHVVHCKDSFISHSKQTRQIWFEEREMPDDAWEKVRERKIQSGEWRTDSTDLT